MAKGHRALAPDERLLVERLLEKAGSEAAFHRTQLETARVRSSCDCGCPSFDFVLGEASGGRVGVADLLVDAYASTPEGHSVGVMLWTRGDRLSGVEIYPNDDVGAFRVPAPEQVWAWGEGPGPG